jgi:translation initiation factor IF-2
MSTAGSTQALPRPGEPPAAPGAPASAEGGPTVPAAHRRPAKRPPREQVTKRGTSINLDTLKSIVTSQPEAPPTKPSGRSGRRRDGHTRKREQPRPPAESEVEERLFRPSFLLHLSAAEKRRDARRGAQAGRATAPTGPSMPKAVTIYGQVTVGEFGERIGQSATDVISKLMEMGEPMPINAVLSDEMAELLAQVFDVPLTIIPETDEYDVREFAAEDREEDLRARPPVVTVMGHVDHGKTSLLDRARVTSVVDREAGGITQHIGASCVQTRRGGITFLDTPGHEAFTAMRARGADVTDLVVLVVAADDGVKPQTKEAINHARAAEVPILVAVNKIDLPGAKIDRVKQELMNFGLVAEEFGGETVICPVSAKTGEGLDHLLEMISLQAEVLELRANPTRHGEGVVIESRVEAGRGVTATVLILNGTLRIGDVFLSGPEFGKVRALRDDRGRDLEEVQPGFAAEVSGLKGAPEAGEPFLVVPNERIAREIAELRSNRRRTAGLAGAPTAATFTDEEGAFTGSAPEEVGSFRVIIRADVQGSAEAVSQSLMRFHAEDLTLEILHAGVGSITVSDVNLAATTGAIILGFAVRPEPQAAQLAERQGVKIHLHRVIYELIDDIRDEMSGLLQPTFREVFQGRAEVREVFRISDVGNVAGSYVSEGEFRRGNLTRLIRDGAVVTEGRKLASLRRFKDDVSRVQSGMECGIALEGFNDIKEGDLIEAYMLESMEREVTLAQS